MYSMLISITCPVVSEMTMNDPPNPEKPITAAMSDASSSSLDFSFNK